MSRCLLLFAKPAVAGHVKTRLVGELTADQTAALHASFLEDVVAGLRSGEFALEVRWASVADASYPDLGLPSADQKGTDLGERLYNGLREASHRFDCVAAVGSDHPEIGAEVVEQAFGALENGADAVLGPAEDGGYYLVGLRSETVAPTWFTGIPWSSEATLDATLNRFREAGVEPVLLPEGRDIDTPEDLAGLISRLTVGEAECPSTRALLRRWGYLE